MTDMYLGDLAEATAKLTEELRRGQEPLILTEARSGRAVYVMPRLIAYFKRVDHSEGGSTMVAMSDTSFVFVTELPEQIAARLIRGGQPVS